MEPGSNDTPNMLEGSVSAYLRGHAHDPVAWRPWGPAALADAAATGRPLLLSIGYQSCHWCHVMQRESFRDPDIAGFMSSRFVPIKIDREMRPDLDALYQGFVSASTGSGGWPLTVIATPEGVPLLGGTYFPPRSPDPARPGLRELLDAVMSAWTLSREQTMRTAEEVSSFLREMQAGARGPVSRIEIEAAAAACRSIEDTRNGGLGGAPKFPQVPALRFLLAYGSRTAEAWPLESVRRATLAMIRGGIYDHVGGGLFRYATDATWTVPHFEKMLYDQAQLLSLLAHIQTLEPSEEYAHAARGTVAFLERELARPESGFFSSLDADTEGVEGATYVWTHDELAAALDPGELRIAESSLGVTPEGNWDEGTNVLTRREGREHDAGAVDRVLERLLELRSPRAQPALIDNTLTAWNALAARGLIECGHAFDDRHMTELGLSTLDWLLSRSAKRSDVWRVPGQPSRIGVTLLEDYATLASACLAAVAHADRRDLIKRAAQLQSVALKRFSGDDGLVMSAGDGLMPVVPIEQADTPTPSGAALIAENAVILAGLTDDPAAAQVAREAIAQFGRTVRTAPYLAGSALQAAVMLEF